MVLVLVLGCGNKLVRERRTDVLLLVLVLVLVMSDEPVAKDEEVELVLELLVLLTLIVEVVRSDAVARATGVKRPQSNFSSLSQLACALAFPTAAAILFANTVSQMNVGIVSM